MSNPLLSIGMSGDSDAFGRLSAFDAVAALRRWGEEWGPKVTEAIQDRTPVKQDTGGGALRDSVAFGGVQSSASGVSMQWTTDKFYGRYLIEGTRAHGPVTAPLLRWQANGHWVSRHWVAGIEPQEWPLDETVRDLLPAMGESLAALFEEM